MVKVVEGKNQIERIAKIRAVIKRFQKKEEELVADAVLHLKTYGSLKQDNWSAVISLSESRRPKWKEEFVAVCGDEKAKEIIEKTPASVCTKLEVYRDGVKVV